MTEIDRQMVPQSLGSQEIVDLQLHYTELADIQNWTLGIVEMELTKQNSTKLSVVEQQAEVAVGLEEDLQSDSLSFGSFHRLT